MSLDLHRRADLTPQQVARLENSMAGFYRTPPAHYYPTANQLSANYTVTERPFHCDLVSRVAPGNSVLELGCGTAHLCPYVEARGGVYTGVDYSEALLADNRRRFPKARFVPMTEPLGETFDLVASLYTIEHVADPVAYLDRLRRHCKPGGLIGVICPEFVDCPALPAGVFLGKTPRRLREKLASLSLLDALHHFLDLKVVGPRWKAAAQNSPPGAFWMNLQPRVLHGAPYAIDADAVYCSRLKDLVWHFEQRGDAIVQTSAQIPNVSPEILRFNCYVLARKAER
jgi:SAM-dependent methyltransferase